jgi:hypothetical protein
MTRQPDIEQLLEAWLSEGPTDTADAVFDAAVARVYRQRQRLGWRLLWRLPMNTNLKLAVAGAAVLVVALAAWQLLPDGSAPGVEPSTRPSPTVTLAPSPTATVASLPEGAVAAGTYRLRPFPDSTLIIDATVPGGGWLGGPPSAIGGPVGESNAPNGVAVAFLRAQTIHSDPCHWDKNRSGSAPQDGDVEVGPTVDDLAEALANAPYESTAPVAAMLGGYSGKRLELHLVPDPSGCDTFSGDEGQYFVFGGRDGSQFAQGGANTWQVTIVDVAGTRLIAVLMSYEETSAADLTAAQAILDSVVITP